MKNGFERRKEHKKESILRAALDLFKSHGFAKVTIVDIARYAKVSQVTIYNHFGSKENLEREVIIKLLLSILEKYRTIVKGEGIFIEKLVRIVFDRIEMLIDYQGELTQEMIRVDTKIRQFVNSTWLPEVNKLTVDLFNQGKREGYVNQEVSEEAFLVYYEILRRGVFASSNIIKSSQNLKIIRELMILFLYGLGGKTEQPEYHFKRTLSVVDSLCDMAVHRFNMVEQSRPVNHRFV